MFIFHRIALIAIQNVCLYLLSLGQNYKNRKCTKWPYKVKRYKVKNFHPVGFHVNQNENEKTSLKFQFSKIKKKIPIRSSVRGYSDKKSSAVSTASSILLFFSPMGSHFLSPQKCGHMAQGEATFKLERNPCNRFRDIRCYRFTDALPRDGRTTDEFWFHDSAVIIKDCQTC